MAVCREDKACKNYTSNPIPINVHLYIHVHPPTSSLHIHLTGYAMGLLGIGKVGASMLDILEAIVCMRMHYVRLGEVCNQLQNTILLLNAAPSMITEFMFHLM